MDNKPDFGQRVNRWLDEAPGQIFKKGKWKFWFPLLIVFSILNAVLTAAVFAKGDNLQAYMGVILLAVGVMLAWACVGTLHYSDSEDSRLARGVSLLDSITLIFVISHFCFLLWTYGHLVALQSAEADYKAQAEAFNAKAEKISVDNVAIAQAAREIARETTKAERLRNDTAYQQRKAAEAGARIRSAGPRGDLAPSLSTAPIELERPKAPAESSTVFLAYWDRWIRLANFGELILAAVTLIYIRNRSAAFNSKNAPAVSLSAGMGIPVSVATLRQESAKTSTPVATDWRAAALLALRDHLGVIASGLPNRSFKADLRKDEGVWIRLYESRKGREEIIAKTCQSDKLLAAVDRPDFGTRLLAELIRQGFPIGGQR